MPEPESDAEKERLIQAYVEGLLTPQESARLQELLRQDPLLARVIVENLRMDGAIREIVGEKEKGEPALRGESAEAPGRRSSPRLRTVRGGRRSPKLSLTPWVGIVAAACLLLVAGLAFHGGRRAVPAAPSKSGASREDEARRTQAEEDRRQAEETRRRAEDRLREIAREREALTRPEPKPTADPAVEEKRRTDLVNLDRERERIESEMRGAIEKAQKAREQLSQTPGRPQDVRKEEPSPAAGGTDTRAGVAKVERVEGEVYLLAEGKRIPLTAPRDLLAGQGLEAAAGANRAALSFPDKTRAELGPGTAVREVKVEGGKRIFIERGSVRAEVAKQPKDQPMIFATPHGEVKVLGTTLRITVDLGEAGSTRVEVIEGKVQLKDLAGRTVDVPSGHYAVAATGAEIAAKPIPKSLVEMLLEHPGVAVINFGPEGVELPKDVLNDSGKAFDPARGYGWEKEIYAGTGDAARLKSDPLRGSFVYFGSATQTAAWTLLVPSGRYLVTVSAGSYFSNQGPHHVRIQDKLVMDAVMTDRGKFHQSPEVPVEVVDGKLTMVIGGHRTNKMPIDKSDDTVINFLVLKRAKKEK